VVGWAGLGELHARIAGLFGRAEPPRRVPDYLRRPGHTSLADLITVAGSRCAIEECLQAAKGEAGLEHYRVRDYTAGYRHITLAR
jgi:hypothetical protein